MRNLETHFSVPQSPDQVRSVLLDYPSYARWNSFMREASDEVDVGKKLNITPVLSSGSKWSFKPKLLVVDKDRELPLDWASDRQRPVRRRALLGAQGQRERAPTSSMVRTSRACSSGSLSSRGSRANTIAPPSGVNRRVTVAAPDSRLRNSANECGKAKRKICSIAARSVMQTRACPCIQNLSQ